MKMTVTTPREVDAKYLYCYIKPRYWEDSEINEECDNENGDLIKSLLPNSLISKETMMEQFGLPERYADGFLHIVIDIDEGKVVGWPEGNVASFGYKSVDENIFILEDEHGNTIFRTPEGDTEYVIGPKFMNDYGDYFVLQVEEDGSIVDWDQDQMVLALKCWMGEEY